MANRKVEIDIEQFRLWARAGATQAEIAQRLKMSLTTLKRRLQAKKYRHEYEHAQAELKISLRARQVRIALNDKHPAQATMLIWLGKNFLGQTDRAQTQLSGPGSGSPLQVIIRGINEPNDDGGGEK